MITRRGRSRDRRKAELWTLVAIIAAIGLPVFLAYVLVAADMRPDLSDLKPREEQPAGTPPVIGWPHIEPLLYTTVRMLGYMMDGYKPSRDGDPVEVFILLPDAGQLLHPAHRISDQMVEIRLRRAMAFQFRRLVWASGNLSSTGARPHSDRAAWAMTDAEVTPAGDHEITRWFTP